MTRRLLFDQNLARRLIDQVAAEFPGAVARLELMIVIEVDFNHQDGAGRLLLADLVVHEDTPFGEIATSGERLLFVDGGEFVEGTLAQDPELGWVGAADWATQDRLRSYPADRPVPTPLGTTMGTGRP